jgi:hypothetical protein
MGLPRNVAFGALATAGVMGLTAPAQAQTPAELAARLKRLEAIVDSQAKRIAEQDAALAAQKGDLLTLREETLAGLRGAGAPGDVNGAMVTAQVEQPQVEPALPGPATASEPRTVGQEPPRAPAVQVAALPENTGILTPRGGLLFEPAVEYVHASTNRLVFRGVEIVTGVQIGVIEASDADRSTVSPSATLRYGITNRLEVDGVIPYVARRDRVVWLSQRDPSFSLPMSQDGYDFGDIEVGARYQLNRARPGRPVYIASLRVKSDTGSSPFDVTRDAFGVATELATGSGFWSISPGISFLYPTDPAVIFAGMNYSANIKRNINKIIGSAPVGEVDPGDSIGVNAGFGFALNPQFSFSLGYRHDYIFPTKSVIGGTKQKSESLQVGSFTFGWSLRLTQRLTLSNNYDFGVTSDAPDVRVAFRLPYRF